MLSSFLALAIWVVPFILYGIPMTRVTAILYDEPFGRALVIALCGTTLACTLPRVAVVWRRMNRTPSPDQAPQSAGGADAGVPFDPAAARRALGAAGFRHVVVSADWCWGVRRRYAPVGSLIFHLSILLIGAAALQAAFSGSAFSGKFLLNEGQTATIEQSQYFETEGDGDAPTLDVSLDDIQTDFHEDVLLFTRLQARLSEGGGASQRVAVGHPMILGPETLLSLGDFGWALEVSEASAVATAPAETQTFALKVFPPGSRDEFTIALGGGEYRVVVEAYGDYVSRDGKPGVESFDLSDPRVVLSVWRVLTNGEEKLMVDSELVEIPGAVEVGASTLQVHAMHHYGVFTVSRTPGSFLALLGLVMMLIGTSVRLMFPRAEALIARNAEGHAELSIRVDVYRHDPRISRRVMTALGRTAS